MINNIINDFINKKIIIVGFGKEGKASYHFIRRYLKKIPLVIADINDNIKNNEELSNDPYVKIITGKNYLDNLNEYDLIIKSPGITFKDIDTTKIKDKISSGLEIVLKYYKDKIIGITGTKGKSTTSSLIYNILKENNIDTILLGNIGNPVLDYIELLEEKKWIVIEMSCDQLEFVTYSPHIAVITNFYEDHLDHLGTLENYYKAKLNITKYQNNNDYLIYYDGSINLKEKINNTLLNSNKITVGFTKESNVYCYDNNIYIDNKKVFNANEKRNLIGEHNLINIMLSITVANIIKLDKIKVKKAINSFSPLEHRLELVGTYNGITYYNDAISTIPLATIEGIKALGNVNTLIFGGLDRGINYDDFIYYLDNSNIDNLICMPTTGHKIATKLKNKKKNIYLVDTLEEAVSKAKEVTKKNTICLMSPAGASYEYFKNFEEKGNKYKELVKK